MGNKFVPQKEFFLKNMFVLNLALYPRKYIILTCNIHRHDRIINYMGFSRETNGQ